MKLLRRVLHWFRPAPEPVEDSLHDMRDEDELLNDPFDIWGSSPSYRCFVARHKDCEPDGAEDGCTCSCGHQKPVCACGLDEAIEDGTATPEIHRHQGGCPKW